ncbi:probably inactive leucine-rich repeat receptor-like protein kinase IMK2 [Actinidia eriantha]|uniref:probably inactive leucine-rich repeat receptor-like protein kinase IMK2 n=1 Tax=Actinidia eriantha TaxID=165200 RepID=UPI002587267C|nr:probably inactive leucine-rich repeat receptor-like protein kinase IMK2 [Actinidia eriantha]
MDQLPKNPFHLFLLLLFFASVFASGQSGDGVIITQADLQSLKALKREFIDSKGFLKSWNDTGRGACSGDWVGIKCVQGQVIAVQLPWKGLGGKITEKIGQLQGLRRLSLHDNALTGPVPNSLGSLPNLRGVYLFNNRLSGSIPASISLCPVLQTLDLSKNQLTGTIFPSIANSTRLYRLNLSFNSISGSIPVSLSLSPSLTFLALQSNNLSGSVPDSWGSGTENKTYHLQILTLDHNLISGRIPTSLSKLGSLEMLSLSHNRFDGTIPNELGALSKLQMLDLSENDINGKIPESIDRLQNLSVLNLNNNHFNGQIPETIGNISKIAQLDLSNNNFSGEIPNSLSKLPLLTSFNVSFNNLSGLVPSLLSKKFNSSSFVGNLQLCGYSPLSPCPSPPPETLPSPSQSKHRHHKLSTKDIILIAAGALLVVLLLLCCVLLGCLIKRKAKAKGKNGKNATQAKAVPAIGAEVESGGEVGGKLVHFDGPFIFAADDLLCATAEIMGKSTYGTIYKATLEDGNQVAVKRLREKVAKGQKEFEAEVAELGKIRHTNLLALRAYYLGPKGEKLLVFDYMSNGSLASFLHARGPETAVTWPTRMKIAMGVTRGLCYLHTQENIIHGNLTSSNVLLDEQSNPKISDVGLSRLMTTAANANVIATAGSLGYRAPELSKLKNATTKTDVYSLGVIILELLTGKSPSEGTDGVDLPQWVASIVKEEWTNEVFDVELMREDTFNSSDELLNTLKLALHCVDPSPAARPEAEQVLQQLEEIKPELVVVSGDDGAKDSSKCD